MSNVLKVGNVVKASYNCLGVIYDIECGHECNYAVVWFDGSYTDGVWENQIKYVAEDVDSYLKERLATSLN